MYGSGHHHIFRPAVEDGPEVGLVVVEQSSRRYHLVYSMPTLLCSVCEYQILRVLFVHRARGCRVVWPLSFYVDELI